jgi:hypothetical protein
MALKNTYTTQSVDNMLKDIQKALIRVKAIGMNYRFNDQGRIDGLSFGLKIRDRVIGFTLPINTEKVKLVLKREGNTRYTNDDYVYRVSWACMRDWVIAQMALIETEMAEPLQVFLPYAQDGSGKTVFEKVVDGNLLLDSGI